ncbi:MAG: hypothetical protein VBE63_28615, partial [Lamprobacter sp.]|uniref:hypothetical protein n=1 Tax=Lamprobacter sp. TaxID=3100796 RepID=UPI002B260ED5
MVEWWAGRYVSRFDVEVAAFLHPDIQGEYPYYNISARLIEPSTQRLEHIPEAFQHDDKNHSKCAVYQHKE